MNRLVVLAGCLIVPTVWAALSGSLDEAAILERIQPEGKVKTVVDPNVSVAPKVEEASPKTLYTKYCRVCHEQGLAGAPKFGNRSEWAPRIAQGIETLVRHSIEGYKAMPPRGTCANCSDEDMQQLVEYMVERAK